MYLAVVGFASRPLLVTSLLCFFMLLLKFQGQTILKYYFSRFSSKSFFGRWAGFSIGCLYHSCGLTRSLGLQVMVVMGPWLLPVHLEIWNPSWRWEPSPLPSCHVSHHLLLRQKGNPWILLQSPSAASWLLRASPTLFIHPFPENRPFWLNSLEITLSVESQLDTSHQTESHDQLERFSSSFLGATLLMYPKG